MKKIYVVIICILIAFIPTYIAIGSYFSTQAQPVKQFAVDKIEILSPKGEKSEIIKGEDGDGFIDFAVSMSENADKILALPEPLLDDPYFTFTYYSYDKSSEYKYYFAGHTSDAYFIDPQGLAYHITKDDSERFLKSKYAHCVYDYSSAPTLLLNNSAVTPTEAAWEFKGFGGEYTVAECTTGESASIQTYGTPILSFDNEPDTISVKLTENGEVIYDGYYSELSNNDYNGHTADMQITATWYDSDDRSYRGELRYNFLTEFKKPPVFYISSTSAVTGDIVTVSVSNTEKLSDINLNIEPSLGYQPKFYSDGEYARALIPMSSSIIPGSYKLTCDYNGQSPTEFYLDISTKYSASYPYNIEESLFNALYNDANIKAYNSLFDSFFESPIEERLFDGAFVSGLPSGTFESADYCDLLTISANDVPFENPGKYYSCTKASNVVAVNAGKVIFAGTNELAGNIVAVDHGLGLVSVYKHLNSISVKIGDSLNKGDLIGISGRTGLISKKSAHISLARVELYIDKLPVNIEPLITNGLDAIK